MIELSIKVKDEKLSLQERFEVGTDYLLSKANPDLVNRVQAVYDKFKSEGDIEAPTITVKAVWEFQS